MNQQELLRLLDKYLEGKASEEEAESLFRYYNRFQTSFGWDERELGSRTGMEQKLLQRLHHSIGQQARPPVVRRFYNTSKFRVAAAVLIVGFGSLLWFFAEKKGATPATEKIIAFDKESRHYQHTTLVLHSGHEINIDAAGNGVFATQGEAVFRKEGNKIIIEPTANTTGDELSYTKLITPRGKQCEVVLADGSQVWLNAASSLRFPAIFGSAERKVEVAGEAYFAVAKNKQKPFRVYAASPVSAGQAGAVIEVTGTQFDVNSYRDESMLRTTLLEGSVKILPVRNRQPATAKEAVLSPGEQAQIPYRSQAENAIVVRNVNAEEVIAWRRNQFNFNNADLQTIMRELARWYDVDVAYEGAVPVRSFSGTINRTASLSIVLKILEQSNIRFKVEGKKITVRS